MARRRIIRTTLSKPITVGQTGIKVKDLYLIIGLTFFIFLTLTIFGGSIFSVPISVPAAFLTLASGVYISRYLTVKKRPNWLKFKMQELRRDFSGFGHNLLPYQGVTKKCLWLTDYDQTEAREKTFIRPLTTNHKNPND